MIAIVVWGDALESVAKKKYRRSGDNKKGRQKQSSSAAESRVKGAYNMSSLSAQQLARPASLKLHGSILSKYLSKNRSLTAAEHVVGNCLPQPVQHAASKI